MPDWSNYTIALRNKIKTCRTNWKVLKYAFVSKRKKLGKLCEAKQDI